MCDPDSLPLHSRHRKLFVGILIEFNGKFSSNIKIEMVTHLEQYSLPLELPYCRYIVMYYQLNLV